MQSIIHWDSLLIKRIVSEGTSQPVGNKWIRMKHDHNVSLLEQIVGFGGY